MIVRSIKNIDVDMDHAWTMHDIHAVAGCAVVHQMNHIAAWFWLSCIYENTFPKRML